MDKLKMKEVLSLYKKKKIVFPECIQRRAVWERDEQVKFLISANRGWCLSNIVLIDVEAAYEFAKDLGDAVSEDWYKKYLDQGYKYIGLDGQNRLNTIQSFGSNQITVTGKLSDNDGKQHDIENQFYKDLDERLKDKFNDIEFPVRIMSEIARPRLAELFKHLNGGVPMSAQELRNCSPSPIADLIRTLSKQYKDMLKKLLTPKAISRMGDDELIAKFFMVTMYTNKVSSKDLSTSAINNFYEEGNGYITLQDVNCPYDKKAAARSKEVLKVVDRVIRNQSQIASTKTVPNWCFWDVVSVVSWMVDQGYVLDPTKYDLFFKEVKGISEGLASGSLREYEKEVRAYLKAGVDPNDISTSDYYFRRRDLPHQRLNRIARDKELLAEVSKPGNIRKLFLKKNIKRPVAKVAIKRPVAKVA